MSYRILLCLVMMVGNIFCAQLSPEQKIRQNALALWRVEKFKMITLALPKYPPHLLKDKFAQSSISRLRFSLPCSNLIVSQGWEVWQKMSNPTCWYDKDHANELIAFVERQCNFDKNGRDFDFFNCTECTHKSAPKKSFSDAEIRDICIAALKRQKNMYKCDKTMCATSLDYTRMAIASKDGTKIFLFLLNIPDIIA